MEKKILQGKIVGNRRGYAFLIPTDKTEKDYFISHSSLRGAMHGDLVLAQSKLDENGRTTARVLKILERGVERLTGT